MNGGDKGLETKGTYGATIRNSSSLPRRNRAELDTLSLQPINLLPLHRPQQPGCRVNRSPRTITGGDAFTVAPQSMLPDRGRDHLTHVKTEERTAGQVVRDGASMGVMCLV
jgi:hypothetical protein